MNSSTKNATIGNNPDAVVATIGDVTLRAADIERLRPGGWLNDVLIDLGLDLLARKGQPLWVAQPAIAHLLAHSQASVEARRAMLPTELVNGREALLVLNDHDGRGPGGAHWSLLHADACGNIPIFRHYDSLGNHNAVAAQKAAVRLCELWGLGANQARVSLADTPQQQNGSDCGIHVLATVARLQGLNIGPLSGVRQLLETAVLAAQRTPR